MARQRTESLSPGCAEILHMSRNDRNSNGESSMPPLSAMIPNEHEIGIDDDSNGDGHDGNPTVLSETLLGVSAENMSQHSVAWEEFKLLANIAGPSMVTCSIELVPDIFSLAFVGQFCTADELAGNSLGTMVANVCGLSIGLGFVSALDTLSSHAYGAGKTKMLGVYLQRAFAMLLLILIPVALCLLNAERILVALGQPKHIAHLAGRTSAILFPGTIFWWMYEAVAKTMQVQGIVFPMMFVGLLSNAVSVGLCYYFLAYTNIGYVGAAVARSCAAALLPLLMLFYLIRSDQTKAFWSGWSLKEALSGWGEFAKLGAFGILSTCLEWWAFELVMLMCGMTANPDTTIGANAVLFVLSSTVFMFYYGQAIATNVRVGINLGANDAPRAKLAMRIAFAMVSATALLIAAFLFLARNWVARTFTANTSLREAIRDTLWIIALYQLPEAWNAIANGIFRGAGLQRTAAFNSFVAYYIAGLPIAAGLAFGLAPNIGLSQLRALWMGITAGLVVSNMSSSFILSRLNWDKLCEQVASEQAAEEETLLADDRERERIEEEAAAAYTILVNT